MEVLAEGNWLGRLGRAGGGQNKGGVGEGIPVEGLGLGWDWPPALRLVCNSSPKQPNITLG